MIVQRIVRAHNGRIELDSHVGRGTTFRLWLPLHEKKPRLLEAPTQSKPICHVCQTNLIIVDDEKPTREFARRAGDRFDVYLAEDAKSAMELLERKLRRDAHGLQDAQRRRHETHRRAKSLSKPPICILMTAYGSEELAVDAMKRGADDYIAKGRLQIDELEMRIARRCAPKSWRPKRLAPPATRREVRHGEHRGRITRCWRCSTSVQQVARRGPRC